MSIKFYNGCLLGFELRDYSVVDDDGNLTGKGGAALLLYIPFLRFNILF